MEKQIVWIDRNRYEYSIDEIDNQYLMNIAKFLLKGGGYIYDTPDMITSINIIYNECINRGLISRDEANGYKEEVIKNATRTQLALSVQKAYYVDKWFNNMFGDVAPNDKEEE